MKNRRSNELEARLVAQAQRIDELEAELNDAARVEHGLRAELAEVREKLEAVAEPETFTVRREHDDAVLYSGLSFNDARHEALGYFWSVQGHPFAHVYDAEGERVWDCHKSGYVVRPDGTRLPQVTATSLS